MLKMKGVKKNSVQWTHWDSNRECLKFDKVYKHSSSANKVLLIILNASYQVNALPAIHIKMHHSTLPNPLGQTSFINGINFGILFRVC